MINEDEFEKWFNRQSGIFEKIVCAIFGHRKTTPHGPKGFHKSHIELIMEINFCSRCRESIVKDVVASNTLVNGWENDPNDFSNSSSLYAPKT